MDSRSPFKRWLVPNTDNPKEPPFIEGVTPVDMCVYGFRIPPALEPCELEAVEAAEVTDANKG